MVKAKSIINIQKNIKKYKQRLTKPKNIIEKFDLELKLMEEEWKLQDVKLQLWNIDIEFHHKDAEFYKSLFVDRYIYGLTQKQLLNKYNIYSTSTLYRKLNIAKEVFEGKKHL